MASFIAIFTAELLRSATRLYTGARQTPEIMER